MKYLRLFENRKFQHNGGSKCPICHSNKFGENIKYHNNGNHGKYRYEYQKCLLCDFEWYRADNVDKYSRFGENIVLVGYFCTKNQQRITKGDEVPDELYSELKITLDKYNL